MRLPSGSRSTHVGHGSGTNDSMRSAPPGWITSGAYCCEVSATVPSRLSSQASNPFTSTTRPASGAVAVRRSAWYRRVRMPLTVPEAKPPRPSGSSHSARLCEGDDVLDALRRPDQQVAVRLDGIATRDERPHRRRPALLEHGEVADGGLERLGPRVHGAEHDLVLEHEVPHDDVGIDLDRRLPPGDAGEHEDAVRAEHLHDLERDGRRAGRLVDEIDVADALGELLDRRVLRGEVAHTDRGEELRLGIGSRLARVHRRVEVGRDQRHRPEKADGAGAEDDRAVAESAPGGRVGAAGPRQPLLDLAHLGQRLLRDCQRLDEDSDVAQRPRDDVHVALVVDHRLGHEAVEALDPALREVAGEAEVLPAGATGHAIRVQAGTADHRYDEIPRLQARRGRADLHHLAERFMADHEVVAARRRGTVLEGADLAVRPADAHVEHAKPHVARRPEPWLRLIDQSDLASVREDGDGLHVPWMYARTRGFR